ncbi:putative protein-serine/threonine kinase [Helianthus anomalus]
MKYQFPVGLFGCQFSALIPNASADAVNLIASLLSKAMDVLQPSFFDRCYHVPGADLH